MLLSPSQAPLPAGLCFGGSHTPRGWHRLPSQFRTGSCKQMRWPYGHGDKAPSVWPCRPQRAAHAPASAPALGPRTLGSPMGRVLPATGSPQPRAPLLILTSAHIEGSKHAALPTEGPPGGSLPSPTPCSPPPDSLGSSNAWTVHATVRSGPDATAPPPPPGMAPAASEALHVAPLRWAEAWSLPRRPHLNYVCKARFQVGSHSQVPVDMNLGDTIQPSTPPTFR